MMGIEYRSKFTVQAMLALIVTVFSFTWPMPVQADQTAYTKSAIRHLKKAVTPQRDESHLTRLAALQRLSDESLEELFLSLVEHDSWQMQVYAVLGLANLSEDGSVTPWLITQLDPLARNEILAISIDEKKLGPDQARTLIKWEDLEEPNRLALLAYLNSLGETLEIAEIEPMLDSSNEKVIAAALLILTWLGDAEAVDRIAEIIAELPESRQFDILMTLVMFIERYQIEEAASWLDVLVTSNRMDGRFPELIQPGTATLLTIEPTTGIRHWKEWVGPSPKRRNQITAALMLLQVGVGLDSDQTTELDGEDELVKTILSAANAIGSDSDDSPQRLIDLYDLNHLRSTVILPGVIKTLPEDQQITVLNHFLDRLSSDSENPMNRMLAIEATERLLTIDSDSLLRRLQEAEDDGPLQEAMLFGILQHRNPGALDTVRPIKQIGLSLPDALALLVIAREADELTETQQRNLGLIASGGVLSEPLQVQAAWLYLKHTDQLDDAMPQLVKQNP
ncbi:MAG: hypothetical protein P8J89_00670 [Phycisphaerales bacterium]|nr:hypothetical protein [Phycisphaerales bacterium]|tara:strand:- start:17556 stop:19079 length:1524 start_codon:yes stop_codon:yes gene_type:complete